VTGPLAVIDVDVMVRVDVTVVVVCAFKNVTLVIMDTVVKTDDVGWTTTFVLVDTVSDVRVTTAFTVTAIVARFSMATW
jgi:hypothetical protein